MDLEEFKNLYGSMKDVYLAERFDITEAEVRRLANELRLGKDKKLFMGDRMPRWAEHEEEMLKDLYPYLPNVTLAHLMGRTVKSLTSKAHMMRLVKNSDRIVEMGKQNVAKRKDRK